MAARRPQRINGAICSCLQLNKWAGNPAPLIHDDGGGRDHVRNLGRSRRRAHGGVLVIVTMVVAVIGIERLLAFLLGRKLQELRGLDLLLFELHELEREVDDLFLIDRSSKLVQRARILLIEFENLAFLSGELTRTVNHGAPQFLVGDADFVFRSDLREDQPKANAPAGKGAIFFAGLFFGGAFGFEAALRLLKLPIHIPPDSVEFGLKQGRGHFKIVPLVQSIEKRFLELVPGGGIKFSLQLAANGLFELCVRIRGPKS